MHYAKPSVSPQVLARGLKEIESEQINGLINLG